MANQWTTHIKEYSQKHGISYGCALSKPECRAEYREKYPKPLTKKQQKAKAEEETRARAEEEARLKAEEEAKVKVKPKGRKPKYSSTEEKYKAKLESNKLKRRERAQIAKKEKYGI